MLSDKPQLATQARLKGLLVFSLSGNPLVALSLHLLVDTDQHVLSLHLPPTTHYAKSSLKSRIHLFSSIVLACILYQKPCYVLGMER